MKEVLELLQEGLAHHRAGRYSDARRLYEGVLLSEPHNGNALNLLGVLHNGLSQYDLGIPYIRRAIELCPWMTEAHYNLGNALAKVNQHALAISSYEEATRLNPAHENAWLNMGDAQRAMRQFGAAEESYRRAIALNSENPHLYVRLGTVLRSQGRLGQAAVAFQGALQRAPNASDANFNLGNVFFDIGAFKQAQEFYRRAISTNPMAKGMMISCMTKSCSWGDMPEDPLQTAQDELLNPFTVLLLSDSASAQLYHARRYAAFLGIGAPESLSTATRPGERVRIGYLSADFHQHATAYLMAELFEVHDRSRFEIVGISYGRDDGSATRRRLIESFDLFLDVQSVDDATAARQIADAGIDILVDLKGYTKDARSGILAHRPAPVQVNYLGYPGTMGTKAVDYILADPIVLPFADQDFYDERIVHLPHCYQVNDSTLEVDDAAVTRAQHGLPEDAFVFCCMNGSQKITAPVFSVWMRVLNAVPNSVLWLYRDNDDAVSTLQRAAAEHGIDPGRLIFAVQLDHSKHLARYRHADLFLDTTPYNAHTTASDALRAHVPVLTIRGSTFVSRVSASLLAAVGVTELVADDLTAYEAEAIRLAGDRGALGDLRKRIALGVQAGPLYDTKRFAKGIEAAYEQMYSTAMSRKPPQPFAVLADGKVRPG